MDNGYAGRTAPTSDANAQWVDMHATETLGAACAVFDRLPQGLVIIDPRTRTLYRNRAARCLYAGDSGGEVSPQPRAFPENCVLEKPDGVPVPRTDWPIQRLLRGESVENLVLRLRRPDSIQSRPLRFCGARVETAAGQSLIYLSIDDLAGRIDDGDGAAHSGAQALQIRELERLSRFYEARTRINQVITRKPQRVELFAKVCDALVDQGGFAMAWIGWRDPRSPRLIPEAAAGRESAYLNGLEIYTDDREQGRGPTGTAFREGRAYVCNHVDEDPRTRFWRDAYRRHGFKASAALPIRVGGEVRGALTVYAYEPNIFLERETALFNEVVEDISFALDNSERDRERAEAQAAAQREHEFSATMLESLPGIFYFYDHSGRFLSWNRNMELLSGYRADEIATMHPLDFIAAEDRARVAAEIERVFAAGEARVEAGFLAKDGRVTPYSFTGRRIAGDLGPCLLGMGIDVADRKRAQDQVHQLNVELERRVADRTAQLQAANRELESFSYSVSHDLRAPLRAVNGLAEIILADFAENLPEEGRKHLQRIRDRGVQMGQLIDDLLAFSRLGRQPLNLRPVDMRTLVKHVVEDLAPQYTGRRVEITVDELPSCECDPKMIYQVWSNLIGNAVKYSRGRDPAIIRVGCEPDGRGVAYFVEDNGTGFDMRYRDKLFRVFQRLHRSEDIEGSGVGLAIVQSIVQRHGGRAWGVGEVNRGARFYFTLGRG